MDDMKSHHMKFVQMKISEIKNSWEWNRSTLDIEENIDLS